MVAPAPPLAPLPSVARRRRGSPPSPFLRPAAAAEHTVAVRPPWPPPSQGGGGRRRRVLRGRRARQYERGRGRAAGDRLGGVGGGGEKGGRGGGRPAGGEGGGGVAPWVATYSAALGAYEGVVAAFGGGPASAADTECAGKWRPREKNEEAKPLHHLSPSQRPRRRSNKKERAHTNSATSLRVQHLLPHNHMAAPPTQTHQKMLHLTSSSVHTRRKKIIFSNSARPILLCTSTKTQDGS